MGAAGQETTVEASLVCHRCSWRGEISNLYACPACSSSLLVTYAGTYEPPNGTVDEGIWRYRRFLPVSANAEPVTLGEGDTPLLQARRLDPSGGLLLKNETVNPTGSFKDRPVAVAATVARELGLSGLLCASTGNTGVAVAAYAARAGLPAACVVPETTPAAKMIQIEGVGARIVRVRGNYSDAYALARAAAENYGWANLTSTYVNPYMVEGDKTVAFELFDQLGERVPDWVLIPVGAGPLLAGINKGFEELGVSDPRMVAVQAAGCAPIVHAFESGAKEVREWEHPVETTASSIADPLRGYPEDGTRTLSVVRESGGEAVAASEEETRQAMIDLARSEGLLVEPGAAVAVAAHRKLAIRRVIREGETAVIVLTGHGLKDPDALHSAVGATDEAAAVEPGDVEALGAALEART
ncbi:MAG: threonine synthase [Actinomycetota bacterium]|nr:threonine synthase [Actinomycetota bacterium]